MGFKTKRSVRSKTNSCTTGVFLNGTKLEKQIYHVEYSRLARKNLSNSVNLVSQTESSSSPKLAANTCSPPPAPSSTPDSPSTPCPTPSSTSRSGLHSDPTILVGHADVQQYWSAL